MDYIKRCGVEIHCNSPIGGDRTINDLLTRDGFSAVFLGVGAQDSIRLPVPGSDAQGVLWGVEYLKDSASGQEASTSRARKVMVIGGGNVAMDVARTARRQGGDVTLICLETREEMPASSWEVEEAEARGHYHRQPLGRQRDQRRQAARSPVSTLRAVERVFDEQGRFSPTYFEDKTKTRNADVVIMAIGQKTNLKFITEADGIKLTPRGLIEADPATQATCREGVFAGGDVDTGPWIAIAAVAAGREAAISIDRYLSRPGPEGRPGAARSAPSPRKKATGTPIPADIPKKHRALMRHHAGGRVDQGLQGNQPGLQRRTGRGRGGPLHQLRRLLRVHAVRQGLPGQGRGPRPWAPKNWSSRWAR